MQQTIINYLVNEVIGDSTVELAPDDDLLSSGLISSMGFFKLIGFMETEYDIKVAPEDMVIEHFMTVDAICNLITRQKSVA